MNIAEILGIDSSDPIDMLAERQRNDDFDMFGRLRQLRESRGWTQRQIAERMDVDQSTVARIESGRRDVHLSTLRLYALALHARIDHRVVDMHSSETGLPLSWSENPGGSGLGRAIRKSVGSESVSRHFVWSEPQEGWTQREKLIVERATK